MLVNVLWDLGLNHWIIDLSPLLTSLADNALSCISEWNSYMLCSTCVVRVTVLVLFSRVRLLFLQLFQLLSSVLECRHSRVDKLQWYSQLLTDLLRLQSLLEVLLTYQQLFLLQLLLSLVPLIQLVGSTVWGINLPVHDQVQVWDDLLLTLKSQSVKQWCISECIPMRLFLQSQLSPHFSLLW